MSNLIRQLAHLVFSHETFTDVLSQKETLIAEN